MTRKLFGGYRGAGSVFVAALVAVVVYESRAFVPKLNNAGQPQHWRPQNPYFGIPDSVVDREEQAIIFHLAKDAFSEENREDELNAVRASFGQWQAVPGTILKFVEGPMVEPDIDVNTNDGTNSVKWLKVSRLYNNERSDITGRLGSATFAAYATGEMAAMDIVINGIDQDWFAAPGDIHSDGHFIEGVMLHEIGHGIGLEHAPIGAATMYVRDSGGLGHQAGLSTDEISFAQSVYGSPEIQAELGIIEGTVRLDGVGLLGAAVYLERADGILYAATLSVEQKSNRDVGSYRFQGVPPGDYRVRVAPLDPASAARFLARGREIKSSRFAEANTDFLPTIPQEVVVSAGETTTLDWDVEAGVPKFRVHRIQVPGSTPTAVRASSGPQLVFPGDQDVRFGVFGEDLPMEDVELTVTGDGITLGELEVRTAFTPPLVHLVRVGSVAEDATPGLRTLIVRSGDEVAYAPGFLDVVRPVTDNNFDGLPDSYQREHFELFTAPEARAEADPDRDGITNLEEAAGGTDPNVSDREVVEVDPFPILNVTVDASGAAVEIESVAGAIYQLFSRSAVGEGDWLPVGEPVEGEGDRLKLMDPGATDNMRFYEVRSVL